MASQVREVGSQLGAMSERGEQIARGMVAALQDLRAESRAQQQALFVVIDRLTGEGPAAA